jgi:SAM-dependent methyltransferase
MPRHSEAAWFRASWSGRGFSANASSMSSVDATSPPQVFDRALLLKRQLGATGEALQELDQRIVEELTDRLAVISKDFTHTLVIGARTRAAAAAMSGMGRFGKLLEQQAHASEDLSLQEGSMDCVISLLDLHGVNDVPGYLAQVARALRPDGLAVFAFFAGGTLSELRESWMIAEQELTGGVSPRVAPMIDLREAGGLLQRAGLALPVADLDRLPLRYGNALTLMHDIKSLGLSNCLVGRTVRLVSRRLLLRAAEIYDATFKDTDGRLPATVEIAWAMAWKPHPSQQKPLKPGSAKARLVDVLKPK